MRQASGLALLVLLSACTHSSKRPPITAATTSAAARVAPSTSGTHTLGDNRGADENANTILCRPDREHRDQDYTPGGLYAPDISDSAPVGTLDISLISEPVPQQEPRSRFGNRSPYEVLGKRYRVLDKSDGYVERGVASWYGAKFNGRATSSREIYDMCSFSAAHKTLPLPTFARVSNLDNGRSVIVRINDRGPFHAGRLIDLSYAAAVSLGVDRTGTARVEVRALASPEDDNRSSAAIAPAPPAAQPPEPVSPALAGQRYIQVGSYADQANARRVAERLREAGIDDVNLDKVDVAGRDVWRVKVGPLADARMDQIFATLRRMGLSGARVFGQ